MHGLDYDHDEDPTPMLQLDEARNHCVDTNNIPPSWAFVPVKLDNNGNIIECVMVAGSGKIFLQFPFLFGTIIESSR